ncbi:MAG: SpoIIE family protein phosphatase [Acidobacteria bacterium]|nr:SpoIIE family protein phosphatase [Acidobacteriota bacterium]
MEKTGGVSWARLGRVEKALLVAVALYALLYFTGVAPLLRFGVAVVGVFLLAGSLYRLARYALRNLIWRLRNRLIVAYLFIAVVPIVLILVLLATTAYVVVGQMAVYLVYTELQNRMRVLTFPANNLARAPARDPQIALNQTVNTVRRQFKDFELLSTGETPLRYPPDSKLAPPPEAWKNTSGLVLRLVDGKEKLYGWAHSEQGKNEVTIIAPITPDLLDDLRPGIGDVNFKDFTPRAVRSHVPPQANALDFRFTFLYPVDVPYWDEPEKGARRNYLLVDTRFSAVLAIIFGQKADWSDLALTFVMALITVFLLVEVASLYAGVKLTRTITGAVHEMYEGTEHVRKGDFGYRIRVQGNDQLAELGQSFNAMTENLGRLIVVAKEKERLESELAIAREVQNQLFPKQAPEVKSLELRGVCNPARMVSGDYYDFMTLPHDGLAFAIGDVAGKGISAALLMASIQSTMRTQLAAFNGNGGGGQALSAATLVSTLNRQLYATTSPEKYATFYFALYDEKTHALTYTNAGHLAPMLLRGQEFQMLDSTGTVVGAFPIARYEEKTVTLEPGDLLLAYTDGIVEPENVYGEQFGEERLQELMIKYAHADSSELIARTMEAVVQWTGADELPDDMTMVVARRI